MIFNEEWDLIDFKSENFNHKAFLDEFNCGNEQVNKGLLEVVKNLDAHRLLLLVIPDNQIIGIMTLSLVTTTLIQMGRSPLTRFPVLNIDLLGISESFQHQQYGSYLVQSAFRMALSIDAILPLHGVHLEAIEDAVEFYEKLGMTDLGCYYPGRQFTQMFISMDMLRESSLSRFSDPYQLKDEDTDA